MGARWDRSMDRAFDLLLRYRSSRQLSGPVSKTTGPVDSAAGVEEPPRTGAAKVMLSASAKAHVPVPAPRSAPGVGCQVRSIALKPKFAAMGGVVALSKVTAEFVEEDGFTLTLPPTTPLISGALSETPLPFESVAVTVMEVERITSVMRYTCEPGSRKRCFVSGLPTLSLPSVR